MVASHLKINWDDDTADGIAVTFKIKNKNRSQVRVDEEESGRATKCQVCRQDQVLSGEVPTETNSGFN